MMPNRLFVSFLSLGAMVLSAGCSKEGTGPGEDPTGGTVINLTAGIETVGLPVRADADIPVSATASVWVYKRAGAAAEAPVATSVPIVSGKRYTVPSAGKMSPSDGKSIYLEKGDYDIYSFGLFSAGPLTAEENTVSAGKTGALSGGKDYIFAASKALNIPCGPVQKDVPLTYSHVSTRIVLEITKDDASVDKVTAASVKMTPSVPSAQTVLDFSTGKIVPALAVAAESAAVEMARQGTGNVFCYIMLPVVAGQKMSFAISAAVTVKGQAEQNMTLKTAYTPPSALEGGKVYVLKAKVAAAQIVIEPGLEVEDWDYSPGNIDVEPIP